MDLLFIFVHLKCISSIRKIKKVHKKEHIQEHMLRSGGTYLHPWAQAHPGGKSRTVFLSKLELWMKATLKNLRKHHVPCFVMMLGSSLHGGMMTIGIELVALAEYKLRKA